MMRVKQEQPDCVERNRLRARVGVITDTFYSESTVKSAREWQLRLDYCDRHVYEAVFRSVRGTGSPSAPEAKEAANKDQRNTPPQ